MDDYKKLREEVTDLLDFDLLTPDNRWVMVLNSNGREFEVTISAKRVNVPGRR